MDHNVSYYNERFPKGSKVRIASRAALEEFIATWNFHHKLRPHQFEFADQVATVKSVGFYHGGDPVYELENIPGFWLDPCLLKP